MEIEAVQKATEPEEAPKLRRSSRGRKPRNVAQDTTSEMFKDMNLKTFSLEGHHHDVCSVDMFKTFIASGG